MEILKTSTLIKKEIKEFFTIASNAKSIQNIREFIERLLNTNTLLAPSTQLSQKQEEKLVSTFAKVKTIAFMKKFDYWIYIIGLMKLANKKGYHYNCPLILLFDSSGFNDLMAHLFEDIHTIYKKTINSSAYPYTIYGWESFKQTNTKERLKDVLSCFSKKMLVKVQKEAKELERINLEEEQYRWWEMSASDEKMKEESERKDKDKNEQLSVKTNTKVDLNTIISAYPIRTQHKEEDNCKASANEDDFNDSIKDYNKEASNANEECIDTTNIINNSSNDELFSTNSNQMIPKRKSWSNKETKYKSSNRNRWFLYKL